MWAWPKEVASVHCPLAHLATLLTLTMKRIKAMRCSSNDIPTVIRSAVFDGTQPSVPRCRAQCQCHCQVKYKQPQCPATRGEWNVPIGSLPVFSIFAQCCCIVGIHYISKIPWLTINELLRYFRLTNRLTSPTLKLRRLLNIHQIYKLHDISKVCQLAWPC